MFAANLGEQRLTVVEELLRRVGDTSNHQNRLALLWLAIRELSGIEPAALGRCPRQVERLGGLIRFVWLLPNGLPRRAELSCPLCRAGPGFCPYVVKEPLPANVI